MSNMTTHAAANTENGKTMDGNHQYSTFYIGDLFFGIEVLKVQEVLRYLEMTRVPLAPGVIEGLINLRGQIVTAVDMRRRLGFPRRTDGETPMNMVVRSDEGAVSLLVDEIGDVLDVTADSYESAPDNMPKEQREMIEGVYKLDGRLLLVLNTERVLQTQALN
ncbi:MAG TPA: chemotaxis protein CheW [Bryobacteraceae bacterium]|nr:chemotaxis protein CheW [Bryobacteraceae bacterium]